jgi:hypothetical protein
MRINHFTLLAAPILVSYSNFCIANPLSVGAAIPRIAPASVGDTPEPTCTPPGTLLTTHGALGTFSSDCIAAANEFFNLPLISRIPCHWKRNRPGAQPPPGYNFLPLSMAPRSCMIRLDVLSDPDAEDQFALVEISEQFRALFRKCVRPGSQGSTGGFVPVGPRQVLKLSVSPTPMGWVPGGFRVEDKSRLNMTTFLSEISDS